jgi:hypothetical protein
MHRSFIVASVSFLALAGCGAQSVSPPPSAAGYGASSVTRARQGASSPRAVTLQWSPTAITMRDAGPYAPSILAYTQGDTVFVNYYAPCNYQIDYQLFAGPVKNGIESDGYHFYAYSGKFQPPYHCTVQAELKDSGGHVVARANLAVTITYPRHHPHGG